MSIVVARIDDRLVHGQVVIGWGRPLRIDRIALIDADVAASALEQDLYRMAAPPGIEVEFPAPEAAAARIEELAASSERVMVLTGTVPLMVDLVRDAGLSSVNLGGLHGGPGRREYLRYVYLDQAEYDALAALVAEGVVVSAQDLPTTAPVPFDELR